MRHNWIYDVLADLRAYAEQNDLPALAAQVTATLRVADLEITGGTSEAVHRHDSSEAANGGKPIRRTH
jgi:hypothetical protein